MLLSRWRIEYKIRKDGMIANDATISVRDQHDIGVRCVHVNMKFSVLLLFDNMY